MSEKIKNLDYYMKLRYEIKIVETDTGYFAEIPDLPGCMTFCEEFNQLHEVIEDAKKAWIGVSIEKNLEIPEPKEEREFSGKFLLRLPKSLHRKLSNHAEENGVSLNQHVLSLLSERSSILGVLGEIKDKINQIGEPEKSGVRDKPVAGSDDFKLVYRTPLEVRGIIGKKPNLPH